MGVFAQWKLISKEYLEAHYTKNYLIDNKKKDSVL